MVKWLVSQDVLKDPYLYTLISHDYFLLWGNIFISKFSFFSYLKHENGFYIDVKILWYHVDNASWQLESWCPPLFVHHYGRLLISKLWVKEDVVTFINVRIGFTGSQLYCYQKCTECYQHGCQHHFYFFVLKKTLTNTGVNALNTSRFKSISFTVHNPVRSRLRF